MMGSCSNLSIHLSNVHSLVWVGIRIGKGEAQPSSPVWVVEVHLLDPTPLSHRICTGRKLEPEARESSKPQATLIWYKSILTGILTNKPHVCLWWSGFTNLRPKHLFLTSKFCKHIEITLGEKGENVLRKNHE